mgnify:CR=1 FL=1
MHTLCKGLASVREVPNTVIVRNVQYKRTTRSPQLQINYTPKKQEHIVTVCNAKGMLVSTMLERLDSEWNHHDEVTLGEMPKVWPCELKNKTRTKFVFTPESILEFVDAIQDDNPVYREEVPVVPELMVLSHMAHHVLDETMLLQLDITFSAPFYGGDVISVEKLRIHSEKHTQIGECELVGTHGGRARCKWIYEEELVHVKD